MEYIKTFESYIHDDQEIKNLIQKCIGFGEKIGYQFVEHPTDEIGKCYRFEDGYFYVVAFNTRLRKLLYVLKRVGGISPESAHRSIVNTSSKINGNLYFKNETWDRIKSNYIVHHDLNFTKFQTRLTPSM